MKKALFPFTQVLKQLDVITYFVVIFVTSFLLFMHIRLCYQGSKSVFKQLSETAVIVTIFILYYLAVWTKINMSIFILKKLD